MVMEFIRNGTDLYFFGIIPEQCDRLWKGEGEVIYLKPCGLQQN